MVKALLNSSLKSKTMKKLLLSLILSFFSYVGFSQYAVMGEIFYDNTTTGVANLPYTLSVIDNGTVLYSSSGTTAINGSYFDSIFISSPPSQYQLLLTFVDCDTTLDSTFIWTNPGSFYYQMPSAYYCASSTGTGCNVNFTTTVTDDTLVTHVISDTSFSVYWNLPNGATATGSSVTYTLTNYNSSYYACAMVSNTTCTDTICNYFAAGVQPTSIAGSVSINNMPPQNAMVYLIEADSTSAGTILVAVDSTVTTQGSYLFSNVTPGDYYVKATLLSTDADYSNYLPSYYAASAIGLGQLYWSNADVVTATANNTVYASFNLVQGTNAGGPGFIGGLISQGANKTYLEGDPINGALVILLDDNGTPVAYTTSNANGEFEFSNLALGTYTVYTEVTGIPTTPGTVTLTSENNSTDLVRVEINSIFVDTYMDNPSGITEVENTPFKIYPNPVTTELKLIPSKEDINQTATVRIFNINGSLVDQQKLKLNDQNLFDVSNYNQGSYLMTVETPEHSYTLKFVK